jgi:hypothetical protein
MCSDAKNYQSFIRVGAGGGRWRSGMTYANLRVVRGNNEQPAVNKAVG